MNKVKELHLILDNISKAGIEEPIYDTFVTTYKRIEELCPDIVYTTVPRFLCWDYAERLFVHVRGEVHEMTLGSCEGTDKEIRVAHNLEKMLLAGAFDWFREW